MARGKARASGDLATQPFLLQFHSHGQRDHAGVFSPEAYVLAPRKPEDWIFA